MVVTVDDDKSVVDVLNLPPPSGPNPSNTGTPIPHRGTQKGLSKRAIAGERRRKRNYKARLRERQLQALVTDGLGQMSEAEWEERKNVILFGMAMTPGPNAQNQLKAIELIDRKLSEKKFSSREAVEATKARCQKRLEELKQLEGWGQVNGVVGRPGAQREAGETSTALRVGNRETTGAA